MPTLNFNLSAVPRCVCSLAEFLEDRVLQHVERGARRWASLLESTRCGVFSKVTHRICTDVARELDEHHIDLHHFSGIPSQTSTRRYAFLLLLGYAFSMSRGSMTRAGVPFCALGLLARSTSRRTVPIAPIDLSCLAMIFASKREKTEIRQIPRWLSRSERSPFFFTER